MKLTTAEKLTTVISSVAILLSTWTFYESYIKESYSLKAAIIDREFGHSSKKVNINSGLILYNDGNKPIVVLSTYLEISSSVGTIRTKSKPPITLKPSEAQAVIINESFAPEELTGELEPSSDENNSQARAEIIILTYGSHGESIKKRITVFTVVFNKIQESFQALEDKQSSENFVAIVKS